MPLASDDPRLERLQKAGFARLVGLGVDHTMRKFEIVLGRRSKSTDLDVVLGDMMSVSRKHAKIYYNFDTSKTPLPCARPRRHRSRRRSRTATAFKQPGSHPLPLF